MAKVSSLKKKVASGCLAHNGKLDIGCGRNKREGFTGIDQYPMDGVDYVFDLRGAWPIEDASVEEVNCSHFLEHLTGTERVHFYNELYRVLKAGGRALITTPHWASNRAYGDPTHQWPPVSEMSMYYLNREWRQTQAPHTDRQYNPTGYDCDFDATWGYAMRQDLLTRNGEYQQYAMTNYKEACQDMVATVVKK